MKTTTGNGDCPEGKSPYGNNYNGYIQLFIKLDYADGTASYFDFAMDLVYNPDVRAVILSFLRFCEDMESESGAPAVRASRISEEQFLACRARQT